MSLYAMRTSLTLAATFMSSLPLAAAAVDEEGYPMGKAWWGAFTVPAPLSVQAERDLLLGEEVFRERTPRPPEDQKADAKNLSDQKPAMPAAVK